MHPLRPYWAQLMDGLGDGVGQWKMAGAARADIFQRLVIEG
jgi:hypothetical protein